MGDLWDFFVDYHTGLSAGNLSFEKSSVVLSPQKELRFDFGHILWYRFRKSRSRPALADRGGSEHE